MTSWESCDTCDAALAGKPQINIDIDVGITPDADSRWRHMFCSLGCARAWLEVELIDAANTQWATAAMRKRRKRIWSEG